MTEDELIEAMAKAAWEATRTPAYAYVTGWDSAPSHIKNVWINAGRAALAVVITAQGESGGFGDVVCDSYAEENQRLFDKAEKARAAIEALAKERDAIAEENARLRAALEPFAKGADNLRDNPPDDSRPSHGRGVVKAGDLRRARAALNER